MNILIILLGTKRIRKPSMYLAFLVSYIHSCRLFHVSKFNYRHVIISNTQLLLHTIDTLCQFRNPVQMPSAALP